MTVVLIVAAIFWLSVAFAKALMRQQAKHDALARRVAKDRYTQGKINERVAREQERQAREQEKQAAQLAKHEERIRKLEFRMRQADADIEHWNETLSDLYAMLDYEKMQQSAAVVGGKEHTKHQSKIITLNNRVYSAEARLAKAQYAKEEAARQLEA